jgi:hypothetical protein
MRKAWWHSSPTLLSWCSSIPFLTHALLYYLLGYHNSPHTPLESEPSLFLLLCPNRLLWHTSCPSHLSPTHAASPVINILFLQRKTLLQAIPAREFEAVSQSFFLPPQNKHISPTVTGESLSNDSPALTGALAGTWASGLPLDHFLQSYQQQSVGWYHFPLILCPLLPDPPVQLTKYV